MKSLKQGEYQYKEVDFLGGGTFGKVYRGIKVSTGQTILAACRLIFVMEHTDGRVRLLSVALVGETIHRAAGVRHHHLVNDSGVLRCVPPTLCHTICIIAFEELLVRFTAVVAPTLVLLARLPLRVARVTGACIEAKCRAVVHFMPARDVAAVINSASQRNESGAQGENGLLHAAALLLGSEALPVGGPE